jgi:hypothetical protein
MNTVAVEVTERNAYDFRLVVSRTMYDEATGTAQSPSLGTPAAWVGRAPAPARPGACRHHCWHRSEGHRPSGPPWCSPRSPTTTVLRGTAWVPFNNPGPNVGDLIDCFAAVNDVRIENL